MKNQFIRKWITVSLAASMAVSLTVGSVPVHAAEPGTAAVSQDASAEEAPGEDTAVSPAGGEEPAEAPKAGNTASENTKEADSKGFLVSPGLERLVDRRCRFIADKQQYRGPIASLRGAYLIYDNQEESLYYSHTNDHDGGRERIGMGALMALWLRRKEEQGLKESLKEYTAYVYRELYDRETGMVFNDISRNNDTYRLYNYPWMAIFQTELYRLTKNRDYLEDACRTMMQYYRDGGGRFYAIGVPLGELIPLLGREQMGRQQEELTNLYLDHADYIRKRGKDYPRHEVNYEQSIVAPAAQCLLGAYKVSGREGYLEEARRQLQLLYLFHGRQPDYHMFGNAVRHWDGYWFGKYRMLGDTYPHYWSVLTGEVFCQYQQLTGDRCFEEAARAALRGSLSLFDQDGRAYCAMVYPWKVNGERGHFRDPWANDQDWALYYALKYEEVVSGED